MAVRPTAWRDAWRVDLRYTPTTCFETFPFPEPTAAQRARIGDLAAELVAQRQAITAQEGIGLTTFYNSVDEGGWREIAGLHSDLDVAVLAAYGWPAALRDDPLGLRARLAERQTEIASAARPYAPF